MRIFRKPVTALMLAAIVALSSLTMAVARGQMRDAAGSVIICSGAGVVSVKVDADGNPIGPVHVCPDCAISALAWIEVATGLPDPVLRVGRVVFDPAPLEVAGRRIGAPRARGPPVARA